MTLDLKNPERKGIFIELVKKSDAVVNNFIHGAMEKLEIA